MEQIILDAILKQTRKDSAWFTANAATILLNGQMVFLDSTGQYKIGDGVTTLSSLTFYGGVGGGGGDLLADNNLNDVGSQSISRINLGIEIGVDVQGHSTKLDAINATQIVPNHDGTIVSFARETAGNSNFTFGTGKTIAALTVAYTAGRTVTLPLASAFEAGTELFFIDEIGGLTYTNPATFTRTGSDTINLATTQIGNVTNGVYKFVTDGISKWTMNVLVGYSSGTWSPTFTGFSIDPTSVVATYVLIGKLCLIQLTMVGGTSNASTFTITLPFSSARTCRYAIGNSTDNSLQTTTTGMGIITSGLSTISLFKNGSTAGTWTTFGAKGVNMSITYEIQ